MYQHELDSERHNTSIHRRYQRNSAFVQTISYFVARFVVHMIMFRVSLALGNMTTGEGSLLSNGIIGAGSVGGADAGEHGSYNLIEILSFSGTYA